VLPSRGPTPCAQRLWIGHRKVARATEPTLYTSISNSAAASIRPIAAIEETIVLCVAFEFAPLVMVRARPVH